MRRFISISIILFTCLSVYGQEIIDNEKPGAPPGYIGLSFGIGIPSGDISDYGNTGLLYSASLGYRISDHLGIGASVTSFEITNQLLANIVNARVRSYTIGPQLSVLQSDQSVVEIRALIGMASLSLDTGVIFGARISGNGLGLELETRYRYFISTKLSTLATISYLYADIEEVDASRFSLRAGLAYNFR